MSMNDYINKPGAENISEPQKISKLTPLELNDIKLDSKQTLLTPDYLEKLINDNSK